MKKALLTAFAAAALGIALPVAAQNVAIVNGKPVPKARVDMLQQQLAKAGRPVTPEMQGQLKDEVIAREIFLQEAQKRGLDASDDYKAQMELARQTILIRELFADYQKNNPVTDAEIKAEYDKFVAANGGKEYKARHILVATEDDARAAIAELKKGAKFDEVAQKRSLDEGTRPRGGDLDWNVPSNFDKAFADAMVKLEKGKMTDAPVRSRFGFHVIQLDDERAVNYPQLQQVRQQLQQNIVGQRVESLIRELRGKAKIE
jgi:peptidyl-prolyl cis-trans isomerase C